MVNLAYEMDETWDELINGIIVALSPRPTVNHNEAAGNIYSIFKNYLKGKTCRAFADGTDLYLTSTDRFVPDGMVVCNQNIIKANGVHGVPDLVIEILSPSTVNRDRMYKKEAYEKAGVKEYWIVESAGKSIEVYLLKNGVLTFNHAYAVFPDYLIEKMNEEEKANIISEFKCSLFPDLTIQIADVFENVT